MIWPTGGEEPQLFNYSIRTIIPLALMPSESTAHLAFGLMGNNQKSSFSRQVDHSFKNCSSDTISYRVFLETAPGLSATGLKPPLPCAIFRTTCLATHCRKSVEIVAESTENHVLLSEKVSAACLATFSAVAGYVTLGDASCDVSRNGAVRQIALTIAWCNSTFKTRPELLDLVVYCHRNV